MSHTVAEEKSNNSFISRIDPELELKARRTTERICENLHIIANEPSLALYRISEHVRKALPPTVESRCEVKRLNEVLVGAHYDAEYGLQCVQAMADTLPVFSEIEQLLRRSVLLQQRFKNAPQKRVKREHSSLIHRISVHLPSVDIPDLAELRDTARGSQKAEGSATKNQKPTKDVNIESVVDVTKHIGNTPSSDSKPDTSLVSDQNLEKTLLCNQNLDKTLAEIDQVPKSDQQPGETICSVEKGSVNP
ncbi:BLOC-1-related complex subunit 8 homolog isoform X2 [Eurytemora carolleeae]|uniref:BLOC-1-related complex subunit 8 homolog isoform X2 n=1 Tax=Eurytemora carolleeae TaxID=1294199 RepID=UPI000C7847AD|nr:BLOC-1-related complex subunit 8 homolog isoform X2 [Eurytemora carolleeae]|eukprot:XP_023322978.1 BLOC-1-related complex subunit 8 homolog isoform X2 [Eurytemora affinis]